MKWNEETCVSWQEMMCSDCESALREYVDMHAWVLLLHQHISLLIYQDNIGLD